MPRSKTDIADTGKLSESSVDAFNLLYHQYHRAIFANISKLINQKDIAEDILQEVFLLLWENRKKIDPSQDIGGWLFVVSYHKSLAFLKKKINDRIVFSSEIIDMTDHGDTEDPRVSDLEIRLLNEAVNSLSPRKKAVFELCRLQGKSYAEAAGILNVSTETIKDYLKESLKTIRKFIYSRVSGSTLLFLIFISL